MRRFILITIAAVLCQPAAAAEDSQALCAKLAPLMRSLAVDSRTALVGTRDMLPEGVEADAMLGMLDADKTKAALAPDVPAGFPVEAVDSFLAGAFMLPYLERATESYEVAASALEACAAKTP